MNKQELLHRIRELEEELELMDREPPPLAEHIVKLRALTLELVNHQLALHEILWTERRDRRKN